MIFVSVASLVQAGLEIDDKYGEIVALYRFNDANDNGPRGFDAHLHEDAVIVEGGKGTCLQLQRTGVFFSCCNDQSLALLDEFTITFWVKLDRQEDPVAIGMHGITYKEWRDGKFNVPSPRGRICIYAVDGTLVRRLDLGPQRVWVYADRSRAAYWDGKNHVGEPVASIEKKLIFIGEHRDVFEKFRFQQRFAISAAFCDASG